MGELKEKALKKGFLVLCFFGLSSVTVKGPWGINRSLTETVSTPKATYLQSC